MPNASTRFFLFHLRMFGRNFTRFRWGKGGWVEGTGWVVCPSVGRVRCLGDTVGVVWSEGLRMPEGFGGFCTVIEEGGVIGLGASSWEPSGSSCRVNEGFKRSMLTVLVLPLTSTLKVWFSLLREITLCGPVYGRVKAGLIGFSCRQTWVHVSKPWWRKGLVAVLWLTGTGLSCYINSRNSL